MCDKDNNGSWKNMDLGQKLDRVVIIFRLISFNRYKRKRPKVDASIFDSALSHTRRSDASEKRRK